MGISTRWLITADEKARFIAALTEELAPLRAKVGISQGELAYLTGISRQTYSAIEGKKKKMSWGIFLSLIHFFDYNHSTHQLIRTIGAFPDELVERFNNGSNFFDLEQNHLFGQKTAEISRMLQSLDEQGLHTLKTVLMIEYARCQHISGDAVIRSFDGSQYDLPKLSARKNVTRAIKHIRSEKV